MRGFVAVLELVSHVQTRAVTLAIDEVRDEGAPRVAFGSTVPEQPFELRC